MLATKSKCHGHGRNRYRSLVMFAGFVVYTWGRRRYSCKQPCFVIESIPQMVEHIETVDHSNSNYTAFLAANSYLFCEDHGQLRKDCILRAPFFLFGNALFSMRRAPIPRCSSCPSCSRVLVASWLPTEEATRTRRSTKGTTRLMQQTNLKVSAFEFLSYALAIR